MNETFEDYCNRRSWSGYIEPLREMWDDWQRDRGFLIENIDEAEKQRDELLAALHEIAGHPGHILSGSMVSMRKIASEAIAKAMGKV